MAELFPNNSSGEELTVDKQVPHAPGTSSYPQPLTGDDGEKAVP